MNSIAALVILAGFAGQNNTVPARNNQVPPGFNTVQPTNLFAGNRNAPSQTRSGTVYAPSNNLAPGAGSAPSLGPVPSSMNNGNRTYQRRVGTSQSLVVNGYRWGYVHYRRDWRDAWFNFPCYAYTPYAYATQFPSPWYTYYSLPPYIYGNNIVFNAPPYLSWDYQLLLRSAARSGCRDPNDHCFLPIRAGAGHRRSSPASRVGGGFV